MSFLNRLSKSVGKAAEQAKFEADKLVKVNKLTGEVGDLNSQISQATASIGSKVIELAEAGGLQVPEVEELIAQVKALGEQLAGKEAELAVARASKYVEGAAPVAEAAAAVECPECGAEMAAGGKFCASCGHKMEE